MENHSLMGFPRKLLNTLTRSLFNQSWKFTFECYLNENTYKIPLKSRKVSKTPKELAKLEIIVHTNPPSKPTTTTRFLPVVSAINPQK